MHGIAILKREIQIQDRILGVGTQGIITAYLPEENIFAVHFGGSDWIRFDANESEFREIFDIIDKTT